jgi:hypothetical protein
MHHAPVPLLTSPHLPRLLHRTDASELSGYIYEGEYFPESDRIHRIPDGSANIETLRNIFLINERSQFAWIVSSASMEEAHDKRDLGHTCSGYATLPITRRCAWRATVPPRTAPPSPHG